MDDMETYKMRWSANGDSLIAWVNETHFLSIVPVSGEEADTWDVLIEDATTATFKKLDNYSSMPLAVMKTTLSLMYGHIPLDH